MDEGERVEVIVSETGEVVAVVEVLGDLPLFLHFIHFKGETGPKS